MWTTRLLCEIFVKYMHAPRRELGKYRAENASNMRGERGSQVGKRRLRQKTVIGPLGLFAGHCGAHQSGLSWSWYVTHRSYGYGSGSIRSATWYDAPKSQRNQLIFENYILSHFVFLYPINKNFKISRWNTIFLNMNPIFCFIYNFEP